MTRRIDVDGLWTPLAWVGTGSVLAAGPPLVALLVTGGPAGWGGPGPLHWALGGAVALLVVAWGRGGRAQRPVGDAPVPGPGEGSGPVRASAALVAFLALPTLLREARSPSEEEGGGARSAPDVLTDPGWVSHLWLLVAVALLVGGLALAVSGRPEPLRPAPGRARRAVLAAVLAPAVALAAFAVPVVLDRDRLEHTLAAPSGEPGEPVRGDEVAWVWEHPEEGSAGGVRVAATGTGALVLDDGGVWALDSGDGTERWRFRPVGETLWSGVSPDTERVGVLYRDASAMDGRGRALAILESDTGRLVGRHTVHDRVEGVLFTNATFVEVGPEGGFVVRDHSTGAIWQHAEVPDGCAAAGAPVVAGARILVPDACEEESRHRGQDPVRVLAAHGEWFERGDLPGPVEELVSAPDGWAVLARYGGDDPGALALRGRDGAVIAEDLPVDGAPRVDPVDGERLLFTAYDDGARRVEYRLERPVVVPPGGDEPTTETEASLEFAFEDALTADEEERSLELGAVATGPELFAAVPGVPRAPVGAAGGAAAYLLVGAWGSEGSVVRLDTAVEGLEADGSAFGVALAPGAVVVSGLAVGDRAHVVGVGPGT
ncbi:hypothetical protein [Nocardiopsis sp. NPDC006938]|uniref:hypothetical protein n=1 Tax=Nocardiopsis sp. NPDC006938 TaxID=3364337 RepID=UPI0036B88FA1